ncbi:MAG: transketolase family protein [Sphingobacteriia bacterium]|nr:transketolase family protein [Sphingobacteriia bacterium]
MKKYIAYSKNDTRSGFGAGLLELGEKNPQVVALCADLTGSLKMDGFQKLYPSRFFQSGIAEANMIGVAAGMANAGLIPFAGTFANFATGRVYDQIRQSVCYSGKNVKIAASHAGLTLGEDGATHQILEDIGLMRMLPSMTVVVPCDYEQTRQATLALALLVGPAYLRFGRPKVECFIPTDEPFELGKAQILLDGTDVTILTCGHLVWKSLKAAEVLQDAGISAEVINVHTIKPLDESAILKSAIKTGAVVTAEEHNIFGGLGDLVAGVLGRNYPVPMEMVAVKDTFGESGTPEELMEKYGLTTENIVKSAYSVLNRKNKNSF